jgi:2-hydroxychromene-2-carboxylate isomerase
MGELIDLAARREARRLRAGQRPARTRAQFFFDLACPFSYLAAERIERAFDDVVWTPATAPGLHRGTAGAIRRAAEERAAELRLPLVWPERFPAGVSAAMRVALLAAERGRGAAYVLAATRLAFCGGFDLDDPEILAEAATASGLGYEECLLAADDHGRDAQIERAGAALADAGAERLPALRIGRALYWGEGRLGDGIAAARYARVAQL